MEQKTPKKSYPPEWENWNVVVSKLKYVTSGLKAPLSEGYFHPKKVSDYQNYSYMNFNNLNYCCSEATVKPDPKAYKE